MSVPTQQWLFADAAERPALSDEQSSTFVKNMALPVHRWFRYSAGFSATWVEELLREFKTNGPVRVFDPFAGSGTTLLAAENQGCESYGIDSHPFVSRIAHAKLQWRSDPKAYRSKILEMRDVAKSLRPKIDEYPSLIYKCYDNGTLEDLDVLSQSYTIVKDESPASDLAWLTLVAILRRTSKAGTAQWQYVLPRKQKRATEDTFAAFDACSRMFYQDMLLGSALAGPYANFLASDARTCVGVPDQFANLVVTSPPYPNNYDYADATRLEMSFMREITGWGDLQASVRQHLVRSCSQHVPERAVNLEEVLSAGVLDPIREELTAVCRELSEVRLTKGGKKTYHLMVACYFHDLALVWQALRRVCAPGAKLCFVIGDSAPYGVYVPVIPWLSALAESCGFHAPRFERTRDRNVKWKNRKHRVPLQEGRLWVEGS